VKISENRIDIDIPQSPPGDQPLATEVGSDCTGTGGKPDVIRYILCIF
jgi:hypothetical protein